MFHSMITIRKLHTNTRTATVGTCLMLTYITRFLGMNFTNVARNFPRGGQYTDYLVISQYVFGTD